MNPAQGPELHQPCRHLSRADECRGCDCAGRTRTGDFDQARHHSEIAVKLADAIEDPFSQSFAALGAGFLELVGGEPHSAIHWLERSRAKARSADSEYLVPLPTGFLGMAYALIGQPERKKGFWKRK